MKRKRSADDIRRRAIKARRQGMPSRFIARGLKRSHDTTKGYLGSCGATIKGTYHLNALAAEALFTAHESAVGRPWSQPPWRCPRQLTPVRYTA